MNRYNNSTNNKYNKQLNIIGFDLIVLTFDRKSWNPKCLGFCSFFQPIYTPNFFRQIPGGPLVEKAL